MTIALSPFTMPAALAAADQILGPNTVWSGNPDNEEQTEWLKTFRDRARSARFMPEIKSNATNDVSQHVSWLMEQGWHAQITQGQPNDLFLASTLDIAAKWQTAGKPTVEQGIDRVYMKKGGHASTTRTNAHPVVEVKTQIDGVSFFFQQVDVAPETRSDLMHRAMRMVNDEVYEEVNFDFPMVDTLARSDAEYMLGLRSGQNVVTQAAEQYRLQMNHIGGRARAAAEVAVSRGFSMDETRTVKITGPFVVVVSYATSATPVAFAMYCDRSTWKKPADNFI